MVILLMRRKVGERRCNTYFTILCAHGFASILLAGQTKIWHHVVL